MSLPAHDLFLVDPNEFVARRTALAKELRAQGDKAGAAEIAKLRRPPIAVWALNQVATDDADLVQVLVATADAARVAQDAMLGGDAADDFRAALARRRDARRAVAEAAAAVVERSGRAPDTYAREIENTLNVVVASPQACAALGRAELVDGVAGADETGEMFAGLTPARDDLAARRESKAKAKARATAQSQLAPKSKPAPAAEPEPKPRGPSPALRRAREQLERARTELSTAERAEQDAADAVATAEQEVARAQSDLEGANSRRETARVHADRARAVVAQREHRVDDLDA